MTPDDPVDRLERDVKGLLATFGALDKAQSLLTAELDRAVRDQAKTPALMAEIRRELLDALARSESRQSDLVIAVKASCDKGWSDMAKWVEKYERGEVTKREREDANAITRRMAVIGTFAAIVSAIGVLIALLALILGG